MNRWDVRKIDTGAARLVGILIYAGLALTVFTYLVPPLFGAAKAAALPVIGRLPGDLPGYVLRFILTAILFAAVPALFAAVGMVHWPDLGLVSASGFLRSRLFFILLGAAALIGISSAYSGGLSTYYPYSHTLLELARTRSVLYLMLHLVLYFLFYYVPWEVFFRGLLILPFLRWFESRNISDSAILIVVASFQIIPSALIHFGHPPSEMASAVIFGVLAGWLVVRTRSILPSLMIHAAVGLCLDAAIYLRTVGVLPGGLQ